MWTKVPYHTTVLLVSQRNSYFDYFCQIHPQTAMGQCKMGLIQRGRFSTVSEKM